MSNLEMADSVKLVLLGESGVGKTSIVNRYITGSINEEVKPTVGAAFVTKSLKLNGKLLELLIWDTAGQEVYRGLAPMYYRSAVIALIVFDITRKKSYEGVQYWLDELKANTNGKLVTVICGNKADLEDLREIDSSVAQDAADITGALYIETSAITGAGIEQLFQSSLLRYLESKTETVKISPEKSVDIVKSTKKSSCC